MSNIFQRTSIQTQSSQQSSSQSINNSKTKRIRKSGPRKKITTIIHTAVFIWTNSNGQTSFSLHCKPNPLIKQGVNNMEANLKQDAEQHAYNIFRKKFKSFDQNKINHMMPPSIMNMDIQSSLWFPNYMMMTTYSGY